MVIFNRLVQGRGFAVVVAALILVLSTVFSLSSAEPDSNDSALPVWVADHKQLKAIDPATNQVTQVIQLAHEAAALAVDPNDRALWALSNRQLLKFSEAGELGLTVHLKALPAKIDHPGALALNPYDGSLWVAAETAILRFAGDGRKLLEWPAKGAGNLVAIGLDIDESLWALTRNRLIHLSSSGTTLAALDLKAHLPNPEFLAVDSLGGVIWLANKSEIVRLDANDLHQPPHAVGVPPAAGAAAPMVEALAVHPVFGTLWLVSRDTLYLYDRQGALTKAIDLAPLDLGRIEPIAYDPHSASLWLGGENALARFTSGGEFISRLPVDKSVAAIGVAPFKLLPALSLAEPADGSLTNNPRPAFRFDLGATCSAIPCLMPRSYIESLMLDVDLNGFAVGSLFRLEGNQATFTPGSRLPEGLNTFSAIATDLFGHRSGTLSARFIIDTIPPEFLTITPADGSVLTTDAVTISGEVDDPNANVILTDAAGGSLSMAGAHFSFPVTLQLGLNTFTLTAFDPAGNSTTVGLALTFVPPFPPDPATVAPPLDPTVTTGFTAATEFLYIGPNPIQTGVAPGTIEPKRGAVVRGRVLTRDNAPLGGVEITILNHPEFGQTLSRSDGAFDLAVNGGGVVTVNYAKEGFLPAQRQVNAPWRDFVFAPDVVLVPLDERVTTVDLTAPVIQIAQGSTVTDEDGSRQATLLFNPGTKATMVLPDGTTQPLTTINVRATEYTVGPNGPEAMPAPLPPTSGYTYAVELSVDEAIAAGAKTVNFNQPVYLYVDNFLNFPDGGIVPVGYYDRDKAAWIPSDNGRVIRILHIANGIAVLDTTGDGNPDTAEQLAALDVTDAERARLANLYSAGASLWRTPVTHFTPWDCNWPYGPPLDAVDPKQPEPVTEADTLEDDCDQECGSIIQVQNQVLGERVSVVGTPFTLNYRSDRVLGRRSAGTIIVPLSAATVPASLKRIELVIEVAGRRFMETFPATPNQSYTFIWDGMDAYGRMVNGQQTASIKIGYVFPWVYHEPAELFQSFGRISGIPLSHNPISGETTLWQTWWKGIWQQGILGRFDAHEQGLGGWSVSVHHRYDPAGRVLHLGNGDRRSGKLSRNTVISTIAGNGGGCCSGDNNVPAIEARLAGPSAVALGPDGSIYFAERNNHRVRRISPDGILTTVAGTGAFGAIGDGGPATEASVVFPNYVTIGPDGSLYIAEGAGGRNQVRRVSPDAIITTVAGIGPSGFSGDGGPATQANLGNPLGLAVAPDGGLYIADTNNSRIRYVAPDGIITTVAGSGNGLSGDGGPATQARLSGPRDVAVGIDGSVYIADTGNSRIRRVSPHGIIDTVAGTRGGLGFRGDGGPAVEATLQSPFHVAVGPDGSLYITDSGHNRIRRIASDGIINTVAGNGVRGFSGDGGHALQAMLAPGGVAVDSNDVLYIPGSNRIRTVSSFFPQFSLDDILIVSEDGQEAYLFNALGRHRRTINPQTGATVYEFGYDTGGNLVTVADGDGNVTAIERSGAVPTAIVAPDGQRTTLTLDPNGYIASISNPAGESFTMTYTADGLLTSFTNPRGKTSQIQYNALGHLIKDENPAGGSWSLARHETQNRYDVTLRSALNRETTYRVDKLSTGERQRINTHPDGTQRQTLVKTDGTTVTTTVDGTVITAVDGPDPRFGMQAPIAANTTTRTPAGRVAQITRARSASLSDPNNLFSLLSQTDTVTLNGKTRRNVYDAATRQHTVTTPTGRQFHRITDLQGRPTDILIPGVAPINYAYDARGRLTALSQGSGAEQRTAQANYNAQGFVETLTDPLGRVQTFTYDNAGRMTQQTLPDGRVIQWSYDANGNVIGITPPGRPEHGFAYTPVDLEEEYQPPVVPGIAEPMTRYAYNLDKQLTTVTRPDGQTVTLNYDGAGRLSTLALPGRAVTYGYSPGTGQLTAINTDEGAGLSYTHDGFLPLTESWSGSVAGSVARAYNNDFLVTGLSVNGSNVPFAYDNDGFLTQAGNLSIGRNAQNGLIDGTALGATATARTHNAFGELSTYTASHSGSAVIAIAYTRDQLGRITEKTETLDGQTDTYAYTYDAAGRLTDVHKNGAFESSYSYDANGNRSIKATGGGAITGTYDAQDRLLTYGLNSYTYTANGELSTRTGGGQSTSYTYDALGNLTRVTFSPPLAAEAGGGETVASVEYVIDGRNRRIGKMVNGALVQGFLYQDQLNPVAELDGSGNVVSRFVYGSRLNVPDYMIKGGTTYRIIPDHLGSPRLVINTQTGNVEQRLDYDEFGNVTFDTNPGFQPFGFAGGIYDRDTRLVRFGARDYDPEVGRWTAKDPIGFDGGDFNLYGYALNDPVKYVDLNGLGPISFAGCTGFNVGFTIGSVNNAFDVSQSTALLQDQLNRVNEEIRRCPLTDTVRLGELDKMRRDLSQRLLDSAREIAVANNRLGLGDVGMAAVMEGICGLLLLSPLP